jgi:hypothetical protein
LVVAAAFLAALPPAISLASGRGDLFEPVHLFAFSYAVLFVLRPAFDLSQTNGPFTWVGYDVSPTYFRALLIGLFGAVSFYVGYYAPFGSNIARRAYLPSGVWSRQMLTFCVATGSLASIGAFALFLSKVGGVGGLRVLLSGRNASSRELITSTSGYLTTTPLWLLSIGVLLLAIARWRSPVGAVGVFLVLVSQITAISGGSRSWTLPVVVSLGLVWFLKRNRRPSFAVLVVATLFVFVFGITVPRAYRNTDERSSLGKTITSAVRHPGQGVHDFFVGADTAMAPTFAVELQFVPSQLRYQRGATYGNALAAPIPRALWHGKPRPADTQLMEKIWPDFSRAGVGFAFSFFGEPYLNFGLMGVIAVSFLFGVGWRGLYAWFRRAPTNPTVVALYAVNLPFLFVYMRGGLGVDYQRQVMATAPILLFALVAEVRKRRES